MDPFFEALEPEQASEIAQLARIMYEAREHRRMLLEQYHTDDPADLFARIAAQTAGGELEHPAYEHYLAVCILDETRNTARALMATRLKEDGAAAAHPPTPHLALREALEAHGGTLLAAPPVLRQDALVLTLCNGVALTVYYASPTAYSLRWTTPDGNAELGIDTAPGHRGIERSPHHLHLADGRVADDPLTQPGLRPWENLRALIDALIEDPLLARHA